MRLLDELDRHADLPDTARRRRPWPPHQPPTGPDATAVSVVIACRDQGELLVEAVASAERHAPSCEVIVVDDGSRQPRTVEVLAALRLRGYPVVDDAGGGIAAARNAGFARARGRYLLPLDAGDRLQGGFLEPARGLLDTRPGVGVVYAGRREVWHGARTVEVPDFDLDQLLCENFIASSALVRKAAWEACGGYDERLPSAADWDLWIALAERGWQLLKVPGVAFDHRTRPWATGDAREGGRPEDRLPEAIVRKHQALYLQRLPDLLVALQCDREAAGERSPPAAQVTERDGLHRELQAWQERVRFMESTRAWRIRGRLLRWRQLLAGR
jgi:cellulose synthase/poly-beta-1,6-N-acetylglucosamine synthase-like glycosyltransferase